MVSVHDVVYGGDVLSFIVVFNTTQAAPLSSVDLADSAKWTARYDNQHFAGSSLVLVQYNELQVGLAIDVPDEGANEFSYSNAPSDIGDSLGRMLEAFSGMPL